MAAAREEVLLERLSSQRRPAANGGVELMPELLDGEEQNVEEEVGGPESWAGWRVDSLGARVVPATAVP